MAPAQVVTERQPERVRLTTLTGERIMLVSPWTTDGEILGHPPYGRYALKSDTLRVAADSVVQTEIREVDAGNAGAAVVVVLAGLTMAALFYVRISCDQRGC